MSPVTSSTVSVRVARRLEQRLRLGNVLVALRDRVVDSGSQGEKTSLPIVPWPPNTRSIICGRSQISLIACRTRTSLNGALSTRIVNGVIPPPVPITTLPPAWICGMLWTREG